MAVRQARKSRELGCRPNIDARLALGAGGRGFESLCPDHYYLPGTRERWRTDWRTD